MPAIKKKKTKLRSLIAKETVTGLHNHLHDLAYISLCYSSRFPDWANWKVLVGLVEEMFTSKYKTKGTTWT